MNEEAAVEGTFLSPPERKKRRRKDKEKEKEKKIGRSKEKTSVDREERLLLTFLEC